VQSVLFAADRRIFGLQSDTEQQCHRRRCARPLHCERNGNGDTQLFAIFRVISYQNTTHKLLYSEKSVAARSLIRIHALLQNWAKMFVQ